MRSRGRILAVGILRTAANIEKIAVFSIRLFEAGDAFRLLGAVGAVSGAENLVILAFLLTEPKAPKTPMLR